MYKRIARTLTALFLGTGQEVVFQFLSAILWIRSWGVGLYSEWLLLSLLPTLLLRGNTGVFHSATSELIMLFRQRDFGRAAATLAVLRRAQRLFLGGVVLIYILLAATVAVLLEPQHFDGLELSLVALFFSAQFGLFQWQQINLTLAKADGQASTAVMWQNHFRLIFMLSMLGGSPLYGPIPCAAAGIAGQLVVALATRFRFRGIVRMLGNGAGSAARMSVWEMTVRGLQFSLFPFGQTAAHAASVWSLGLFFGPLVGAAFHNMRTISRSIVLVARAVEQAVRLELSGLFAESDSARSGRLLGHALVATGTVCTAAAAVLIVLGEPLFAFITHGQLTFHQTAFVILCAGALVYAMSQIYLSVAFALNRQGRIAERYLVTLVLLLAATVPAARAGLPGLALVILAAEAAILVLARSHAAVLMREAKAL